VNFNVKLVKLFLPNVLNVEENLEKMPLIVDVWMVFSMEMMIVQVIIIQIK
jgi:hypothetical protein